jgi:insulysin
MALGLSRSSYLDIITDASFTSEHLLFLGTEKYPQENAYSTYLSANNGHSNAYTGLSNTNYFFEVAPEALEGALDRFAGFFTAPLFDASCTEREANAVNSEHNKNLQSDMWRFYQLEKHLSSPNHPYHKFGTGTRETLWDGPRREGRDPRAELIDWWKEMYCAKRMKLVLMGRESLDTLEGWVRQRFEGVPVRTKDGEERLVYNSEVMEEEQMGVSRCGRRRRLC